MISYPARTIEWTEIHDTLLCREVLLEEPYKYQKGSNEKGKTWTEIAEALNKSEEVKFKVTQRGVRERMERLQKKHLEKKKEEESASGIAVDDVTELESLIDEIIDRERLAEESRDSEGAQKKTEADKQTADKMRTEVMERFGETKKRSEGEGAQERQTKRRWSGNDAVEFLKEKSAKETEFQAEELALRKEHQQIKAARQGQILAIMQQQQQQTAAMMTLIERLLPKKS